MADLATATTATQTATTQVATLTPEEALRQNAAFDATVATLTKSMTDLARTVEDAAKPQSPNLRKGESIMSSRPFSYGRLIKAVVRQKEGDRQFDNHSKIEMELCGRLKKAYDEMYGQGASGLSQFCAPLSTALMPEDWSETGADADSVKDMPGIPAALVKEIKQHFSIKPYRDDAELAHYGLLRKDQLRDNPLLGGTLVPLAAQGELIEVLRNSMCFTRAPGVRIVPLPPGGSIRYPRQTSSTSISGYSEGSTITESTLGTDAITMTAKSYRGLVDVTDELLRFAGNVSVEALIREDLAEQVARQTDRDMIDGPGGTRMLGVLQYTGIQTHTASTTATNGDTILPDDPQLLYGKMADANAPVDRGFVFAMRPRLWTGITTRKDSQLRFVFDWAAANSGAPAALFGHQVIQSTNIPNTRIKASGVDLTLLLAFVPSEILVGQAGVLDFAMTDSDSSKFTQAIKTVRCITYIDCILRHDIGVGIVDQLLNS